MLSPEEFTAKLEGLHDQKRVIDIEISFLICDHFKTSAAEYKLEAESSTDEIVGAIEELADNAGTIIRLDGDKAFD